MENKNVSIAKFRFGERVRLKDDYDTEFNVGECRRSACDANNIIYIEDEFNEHDEDQLELVYKTEPVDKTEARLIKDDKLVDEFLKNEKSKNNYKKIAEDSALILNFLDYVGKKYNLTLIKSKWKLNY